MKAAPRLVLIVLALFLPELAAADVTRFELGGTVKDQTGSVLPGATVTLRNASTGLVQTTVTDDRGNYFFPPLDPTGEWRLTVELDGFKTQTKEGLRFKANTAPKIDFELELGAVQETVTVTSEAPVVETRISELKQSVFEEQVETLPNNGRNFLQFVELSGSAVRLDTGNPNSGNLSLNGQGRRMANFLSDGVSMTGREIRTMNGEFGGGTGLSLDVIQEVQIISNGFKAEVGRTGAGTISIITKSGTNDFHGGVYTYQRPSGLVAKNQVTGAETQADRQQYGVTVSGPIVKDRTHFFFNWESNRIDDQVTVTSVLDPGEFERPQDNDALFVKVNHQLDANNYMDIRFNWNRNDSLTGFGGLNTFDRRFNFDGRTINIVGSLVSTFGGNKVNELRVRWTRDLTDIFSPLISDSGKESRTPDFSRTPFPAVNRPGIGNTGPNPSLPQNLIEKRFQVVDHFSIHAGAHDLKFGGDVLGSFRFVTFFNNFVGTYTFRPGTPFPFDPSDPATFPFQYTQNFGDSALNFDDALVGLFAQDDWEVTPGVILNLGVRYDYDSLFPGDLDNISPRVGFAWDLGDRGETVLRGNLGIFFDTLESSLINRESNFGPEGQFSIDLRQGDPLFPTFPQRFDSIPEGAAAAPRAVVYIPVFQGDDFPGSIGDRIERVAPYFFNWNIGIEQQLGPGWAVSADLVRVEGHDLLVTFDTNAPPRFDVGPNRTRTLAEADALRPFGSPSVVPGPLGVDFGGFRTLFLQFNGGDTRYWGLKLGLEKRFDGRAGFQLRYTWSRGRGDVDNFRASQSFVPGLTEIGGDRSYQWGPLETEVPHLFVANAIYELPWEIRVSGVFLARSGLPYTGLAGFDADGDGFNSNGTSYGDRAAGLTRNSFRMDSFYNLDVSAAKLVRFTESQGVEIGIDVFNVFNTANMLNVNRIMGLDPTNPRPGFGDKTVWSAPRQAQIRVRYTW